MPLRVQLYNVPLKLYSQKGLSYIASALGRPLYMDSITASRKRLEFAKVCIEVHAGVVLPKSIAVKLPDGSFAAVHVVIPWYPPSCSRCNNFGHAAKYCPVAAEPTKVTKVWRAKVVAESDSGSSSGLVATAAPSVTNVNVVSAICSSVAPNLLDRDVTTLGMLQSLVATAAPSVTNVNVVSAICSSVAPPVLVEGTVVPMLNVENVMPATDVPNGDVASPAVLNEKDVALVDTSTVEDDASMDDIEFPPLQSVSKGRQPRAASLGVTTLLKEMKTMKKVTLGKVSKSVECGGSDLPSVSSQ
ncbi:hypothetical protein V6N13_060207 [Hibiscus sabdariffa]